MELLYRLNNKIGRAEPKQFTYYSAKPTYRRTALVKKWRLKGMGHPLKPPRQQAFLIQRGFNETPYVSVKHKMKQSIKNKPGRLN